MAHQTITVNGKDLKIPTDWEIFTSMPGHGVANKRITNAVLRTIKALVREAGKGKDVGPKLVQTYAQKFVKPALDRGQEFGTWDSEPVGRVASVLGRVAGALGGPDDDVYEHLRWGGLH